MFVPQLGNNKQDSAQNRYKNKARFVCGDVGSNVASRAYPSSTVTCSCIQNRYPSPLKRSAFQGRPLFYVSPSQTRKKAGHISRPAPLRSNLALSRSEAELHRGLQPRDVAARAVRVFTFPKDGFRPKGHTVGGGVEHRGVNRLHLLQVIRRKRVGHVIKPIGQGAGQFVGELMADLSRQAEGLNRVHIATGVDKRVLTEAVDQIPPDAVAIAERAQKAGRSAPAAQPPRAGPKCRRYNHPRR